jgi:hypothetical protein
VNSTEPHQSSRFGKFFHHKHQNEHGEKSENPEEPSSRKTESETAKVEDNFKKEGKQFEDYIHDDEELEEEGKTYGGLM